MNNAKNNSNAGNGRARNDCFQNLLVMVKREEVLSIYYNLSQTIFHLSDLSIVNKTLSSWLKWGDTVFCRALPFSQRRDQSALLLFFSLSMSGDNILNSREKSRIYLREKKTDGFTLERESKVVAF